MSYTPEHEAHPVLKTAGRIALISLGVLIVISGCQHLPGETTISRVPEVVVYFSPTKAIEERLVNEIRSEIAAIYIQAYAMTKTPILDALIEAKGRGVDIQIILDAKWTRNNPKSAQPAIDACNMAKIPIAFDATHPIAHAKFFVFSGRPLVECGSYNYTKQAKSNHEDALFISDPLTHDQFLIDWKNHQAHSKPAP
jgi:phosphatidylserine/phosphatidylglycerophosphate/cardiolipin synthase-like enzyme